MHGEPYVEMELENPQGSGNQVRLEQAKWYLESCLTVLSASPGREPVEEAVVKSVRHALDQVRREIRGEEVGHEAPFNWKKHRGRVDERRECGKSGEVDLRDGGRCGELKRKDGR